jgi:hypothetical protein
VQCGRYTFGFFFSAFRGSSQHGLGFLDATETSIYVTDAVFHRVDNALCDGRSDLAILS